MPHISDTFSSPYAGVLEVHLRGTYYEGTARDAGFPNTYGGTSNLSLRAFVGVSGSYVYTEPIDRYAPTSSVRMDYPGGDVEWDVGTEEVAHQNPGGLYSYGFDNLHIDLVLIKR